jgi:molybdopterin synthase sulfur carrier subunit
MADGRRIVHGRRRSDDDFATADRRAEMAQVTVRYWAGAREAAGRDEEPVDADALDDLVRQLAGRTPALAQVLSVSSLLVDGLIAAPSRVLSDGETVEVLPPFAGG